jgi:tRNA (mo5U34)-methyltransferase
MPKLSFSFRGFGATVEVPERVASAMRKVIRKPDEPYQRLVFADPPPVHLEDREHEKRFAREFVDDVAPTFATAAAEKGQIDAHPWYHTIEFPDGTVTPGRFDHRDVLPRLGIPDDLSGKRALDVGSGDGFWAFSLENRGAEVTSLDVETFGEIDLPPALHEMYAESELKLSFRAGIEIARPRLDSKIKLVNMPVYELHPERVGRFDFVHAGDILLHLRDPALALQRIRSVTEGEALIVDLFDPELDTIGHGPCLTRYRGGWFDVHWWTPSLSALTQMVYDAGFADVEIVTTYSLSDVEGVPGPWRAVIRART